jgi:hypothetical protein
MPSARLLVTCLLTCAAFFPRPARAQAAGESPPGDASQHGGALWRLRLGPTYLSARFNKIPDLASERYSGAGVAFDAEVGRSPTSPFTIRAALSGALVPHAGADDSGTLETGTAVADLATAGVGASFTYATPADLYVAANPAFMAVLINYHGQVSTDFDLGFALGFVAGGEWRVSSGWRLGLAAEARYALMAGSPVFSIMSQYSLLFSATYD